MEGFSRPPVAEAASSASSSPGRVARLAGHVLRGAGDGERALAASPTSSAAAPARPRSFLLGVLAHMILVPSWTVSPALLLAALVRAGLPLGLPGVLASLAAGLGIFMNDSAKVRGALCLCVVALASRAKAKASKVRSLLASGVVAIMAWMVTTGREVGPMPRLCDFLCDRAKDYYAQAEMRGALDDIRPNKTFFAFHPHGCLSAGWTVNGTFNSDFTRRAGRVNWLIDPGLRHKNPLFRMVSEAYRREDRAIEGGDKRSMTRLMERGESCALIPGGFQDAVAFQYGKECAVVRKRKGFVKYCLQYGYRLHPVYTFGESSTYYTFTGLRSLRMKISESNIPMVCFFGWALCPILPFTGSKILTYVGSGIDLPHIPEPTAAEVDHWHGVYLEALQRLFKEKKAEAGCPDAELELL